MIKALENSIRNHPSKLYFVLIAVISIACRAYWNFSSELLPGGGGYYPVQVRSILDNGSLGFPDMPFLFYFDAFIVKLLSFFGLTQNDHLILMVVKVVDTLSIPLLLFPLYKIIKVLNIPTNKISIRLIVAFSVLSLTTIMLTSEFQKNALAITFLFFFLAYYISYQHSKKTVDLWLTFLFFALTGFTHFGTFSVALVLIVLMLAYTYKMKAILPIIITVAFGLAIIAYFDIERFYRLMSVWKLAFRRPDIFQGRVAPHDIAFKLFSWFLIYLGIRTYRRTKAELPALHRALLFTGIACLFLFSFPLLGDQYSVRLGAFLFIIQIIVLLIIEPYISVKQSRGIQIALSVILIASIGTGILDVKPNSVTKNEFADLKKIESVIELKSETIIIAKHTLEWWVAWAVGTDVGQTSAVDDALFEEYETVLYIDQVDEKHDHKKRGGKVSPFDDPEIPENAPLIYSSKHFRLYLVSKAEH